jgi:hypothetical protein
VRRGVVCEFTIAVERALPPVRKARNRVADFVPRTSGADSDLFEVAFLDHPFVRFAHALDAVLLFTAVLRKLPDDLVFAVSSRFMDETAAKSHRLP